MKDFVEFQELNGKLKGLAWGNFLKEDKVVPARDLLWEEGLLLLQEGDDVTQRMRIRNGETVIGLEFGIARIEDIDRIEDPEFEDVQPCELCIGFNSKTEEVTSVFLAEV